MSKKQQFLVALNILLAVVMAFEAVRFFKPVEQTISETLSSELRDVNSEFRSQFVYVRQQLSYYDQNRFVPTLEQCAKSDTLLLNQTSLYYLKSQKRNDSILVTVLNLTEAFNKNTNSNYSLSITPCTDCISLQLSKSIIYVGKKGSISFALYGSIFLFTICFLLLLIQSRDKLKILIALIISPISIILLWKLSPLLPPQFSSAILFNYATLGINNIPQYILLFVSGYLAFRCTLFFIKKQVFYVRSVFVAYLIALLAIYLQESANNLISLTQAYSFAHFVGISALCAFIMYQAVRIKPTTKGNLIGLIVLATAIYYLSPISLIFSVITALALALSTKRKASYLILAVSFTIAISVYAEISFNDNYQLKQTAFVNSLIDRENILQAYDFPELIKEAKSLESVYDLSFEELFATSFQNEYLGYYGYKLTATDSVIIEKKYTPYGLGYFTVFERSKPALQPESYAFYIGNNLVEEQPLGGFQKILPKNVLINYSHYKIDDYTVLLPLHSIDYVKLFSRATFLFLVLYAFSYLYTKPRQKKSIRANISTAVLLFSLGILGLWAGISYYYLTQSERENIDNNILEKTQSLQIELEQKLAQTPEEINNPAYLNALLRKFSTVFFTDINIYRTNGKLLASSRPQVYQAGLLSERINPDAQSHFNTNNRPYITEEELNEIKFVSAYANVNLAGENFYIHLPLFNRNEELQNRIENLTEVFINILLLVFLLASTLSVFLSYSISQPLLRLSNNIRSLSIQGKNTTAQVPAEKELKALSLAYNQKVKELVESVEKLTESEREKTWRSMARQVAHEIKNPLTPIKLNAQFFQHQLSKGDVDPEKFKKFLDSLQEQVNNLTRVANDFSDLASFNNAQPELLSLREVIENLPSYQAHQSSISISGEAKIPLDKSHMARVFNNLISNSIEAIGDTVKAQISIELEQNEMGATIVFSDNGPGIVEEHKDKIFLPNFSTKKTGMGLGLYMITTLIKQNNGTITLEESSIGACFKLRFLALQKS